MACFKEMASEKGLVSDIQRFSIHDGPGIRTLVFMKGCPLGCLWCSNPESQNRTMEIAFVESNCIGCGKCYEVCGLDAIDEHTFEIDRGICDNCGKCVEVCPGNAKKMIGRWYCVPELIREVERDRIFYRNSGGGVTVSGGEPSLQHKFVSSFLKKCQELNLDTAVETCGYAKWEHLRPIIGYSNLVFFDIKHMNAEIHKRLTGRGNQLILENARKASLISPITIRIPVIPGYNDSVENIEATAEFARKLKNLNKIELLPYHSLGEHKYTWLGKQYQGKGISFEEGLDFLKYKESIESYGCKVEVQSSIYVE